MIDFDELLSDNLSPSINHINHSSDGVFFIENYLMTRLLPLQSLIKNMRGEIPTMQRSYIPPERAYQFLKNLTGQDFGRDIEAWENWVKEHPHIAPTINSN